MLCIQIAIVFCIIGSRKHYTVDVWTALYVVPMVWFMQEAYHKDINHKDVNISVDEIQRFYHIDTSKDINGSYDIQYVIEEGTTHGDSTTSYEEK